MLRATHHFGRVERKLRVGGEHGYRKRGDYTIERDPSGDYRRGATFAGVEVRHMQAEGALDEGTRISHADGRRFVVAGGVLVESREVKA